MDVVRPSDLSEALTALAEVPGITPLAGGTDRMAEVNFGHTRPSAVLTLRRLDELRGHSRTRIGAGATFARLEAGDHTALAQLARTISSVATARESAQASRGNDDRSMARATSFSVS